MCAFTSDILIDIIFSFLTINSANGIATTQGSCRHSGWDVQ